MELVAMPIHTENVIYDLSFSNVSVCDIAFFFPECILSIFSSWSLQRLTISWFMLYLPRRCQLQQPQKVPRRGKGNQKQTQIV